MKVQASTSGKTRLSIYGSFFVQQISKFDDKISLNTNPENPNLFCSHAGGAGRYIQLQIHISELWLGS